jgi:hypothetical protein
VKRKAPLDVPSKATPPNPNAELYFISDSLEDIARDIKNSGYRDKLNEAFQAAISRVKWK